MAMKKTLQVVVGILAISALASCGGGGDIAGDSSEFTVSPKESAIEVTSEVDGDCSGAAGDAGVLVAIIGGQAPFRIVNSNPGGVAVDKTEATGKDPKFTIRSLGQCGDPFVITVLDYHSKIAVVKYTVTSKVPQ